MVNFITMIFCQTAGYSLKNNFLFPLSIWWGRARLCYAKTVRRRMMKGESPLTNFQVPQGQAHKMTKMWLSGIGRMDFSSSKKAVVWSTHFKASYFKGSGKRGRLMADAIPTENNMCSEDIGLSCEIEEDSCLDVLFNKSQRILTVSHAKQLCSPTKQIPVLIDHSVF